VDLFKEYRLQLDRLTAAVSAKIGQLSELETTEKTNLVDAINELKGFVHNAGLITNYTHTQVEPQAIWICNHDLGYLPSVIVIDTGMNVCVPDRQDPTENTTILINAGGYAGKAYFN
jgi:hypothetical protein